MVYPQISISDHPIHDTKRMELRTRFMWHIYYSIGKFIYEAWTYWFSNTPIHLMQVSKMHVLPSRYTFLPRNLQVCESGHSKSESRKLDYKNFKSISFMPTHIHTHLYFIKRVIGTFCRAFHPPSNSVLWLLNYVITCEQGKWNFATNNCLMTFWPIICNCAQIMLYPFLFWQI